MRRKTIYVDAEVDLEDYVDEFFELVEDKELLEEVESRGLNLVSNNLMVSDTLAPDKLYRQLCVLVGVGFHTDKDKVLQLLKEML